MDLKMIIIIIFWIICSLSVMTQYAEFCKDLSIFKKILVGAILFISGPIFCAYSAITSFLDFILPDNWEDDDNNDSFKY